MSQFTQLNLQGNSGGKTQPASDPGVGQKTPSTSKPPKKQHGTAKIAAIAGSLIATAFVATLTLGTNGCSKSSKPAITAPPAPVASVSPISSGPMSAMVATPKAALRPMKKSSRQRTVSTYKNADYGLTFRYPKNYSLTKDDKTGLEGAALGPVEMNFVQPGGTRLAAVQLPGSIYPGTDFVSGFFNVNANPKLTAEQCAQFAFNDAKQAAASEPEDSMEIDSAPAPNKVKMEGAEFTEVESSGGEAAKHADAKYYHVYKNGACYEFALGLETAGDKSDAKPVDHDVVFRKLNWMLSTVKITAAGVPAKTMPAVASAGAPPATTDPANTAIAPATTAVTAEGGSH